MTMNTDLAELQNILEKIRQETYPDIPHRLLTRILEIEFEYQDDRKEAYRQVLKSIEEYLEYALL